MGDVKLALLLAGGLDGDAPWPLMLGLALAALFGVGLLARYGRAPGRTALPFAPFFAAGALLALVG
jgi:prepilin signal peptidase PulO-like enzyme (type II secretory pathway)